MPPPPPAASEARSPADERGWPAQRLRRNGYLPALGAAAACVGWATLHSNRISEGLFVLGVATGWCGFWFAVIVLARNAFPLARPVRVDVEPDALWLSDLGRVPRSTLIEGKIVPKTDAEVVVVLKRAWRSLSLRMAPAHASSLLARLGLDAGSRRATFSLQSRFGRRYLLCFSSILAIGLLSCVVHSLKDAPGDAFAALSIAMFAGGFHSLWLAWLLGFVRGTLVIGADGVTIRWLLRQRFIPFHSVQEVSPHDRRGHRGVDDTFVLLASGKTELLRAASAPVTHADIGAEARSLHDHLQTAFRLSRLRGGDGTELLPLVRRGRQPPRAWLATLDALRGAGQSAYRAPAVGPDALVEVLRDAALAPDARAGAAAALLRSGDPEARSAVRAAAGACAEPRLRVALTALDEAGSEDDLLEALQLAADAAASKA